MIHISAFITDDRITHFSKLICFLADISHLNHHLKYFLFQRPIEIGREVVEYEESEGLEPGAIKAKSVGIF